MATPLVSPGILVREVDLTVGRAENVANTLGAIAGPFKRGPVNEVVRINSETELEAVFGKPVTEDGQYEYWLTASSFLSYGGILNVVRTGDADLVNANVGLGSTAPQNVSNLNIENYTDYLASYAESSAGGFAFAAKNPGSWGNSLKVAFIDNKADIIVAINTNTSVSIGDTISVSRSAESYVTNAGVVTTFTGSVEGIVVGVATVSGNLKNLDVKIVSRSTSTGSREIIEYQPGVKVLSFAQGDNLRIGTATTQANAESVKDWFDEQVITLPTGNVYWNSLSEKPKTSRFVQEKGGVNDELHICVYDVNGLVSGIPGNILEKHLGLSKANDTVSSSDSPLRIYWKEYLAEFSNYIYAGDNLSTVGIDTISGARVTATGFSTDTTLNTLTEGQWNGPAFDISTNKARSYSAIGNVSYSLGGGKDYNSTFGVKADLGDLIAAYNLFKNKAEFPIDFLLMGPGLPTENETRAKAAALISVAEYRKDCIACISPHRDNVVNVSNSETATNNILNFYASVQSSSYAFFDTGYKYTFDRYNNKFRYIPCNGDTAGIMVRTGIDSYPWFSPAGQQRGSLNNAVKLAYNPNQTQRDRLYSKRINSIIIQSGLGTLLFGDKTGLGYASAFDRINVRRLFLYVERALEASANAQLFEFNDEITRANFINIVEPFLRDIQSKRGLYDYLVVCDETNNTPDIVDNNEFRADIYLKPIKSINFVTLTFVATRSGVSFSESVGTV